MVSLKEHILPEGASWGERKVPPRVSSEPGNGIKGRDGHCWTRGLEKWSSVEKGLSEGQRWLRKRVLGDVDCMVCCGSVLETALTPTAPLRNDSVAGWGPALCPPARIANTLSMICCQGSGG